MGGRVVLGRRGRWGSTDGVFRGASDLGMAADALKPSRSAEAPSPSSR